MTTTKSTSTSLIAAETTPHPTTAPPCCWFAGYSMYTIGVRGNFYYTSSAVQTVATVYSTVIDYGDREEVANVSTSFMEEDEVFTSFGLWPNSGPTMSVLHDELGRLGIPATLVRGLYYDATVVYPASSPEGLAPYPTPYMEWNSVQVYYDTDTACRFITTADYASGNPVTTRTVASTEKYKYIIGLPSIEIDENVPDAYTTHMVDNFTSNYFYIQTLPVDAPRPTAGWHPLPSGAIRRYMSFQTSAYPWMTDCIPVDTPGEPTVHIAVNYLTETSRVTLMMARSTTDSRTQLQPQATGNALRPPMTPTPSPSADNGDEPLPVQSPTVAVSKSASKSFSDVVSPQSEIAQSVTDVETIRDQTTRDQLSSPVSEEANPMSVSPTTAPLPAPSSPGKPGSSQDGQTSADNAGDDDLTGPTMVTPEDISASTAVQNSTLANTATSQSLATTALEKPSDPIVAVSMSFSASSTVEIGTNERTIASQTASRVIADESKPSEGGGDNDSIPSAGKEDDESEGSVGSISSAATTATSATVVPEMTTLPDRATDIQAIGDVGSVRNGSVASTLSSSAATGGMGDAIMSGLGQTGTRNGSAGYTGPAYTGDTPGTMVNNVVAVSLGLTWLAWVCM